MLLVTFNWPENSERYRRTAKFVDAFFSKIDEFLKPLRHPKWAESSTNVKIPGWERFKASDDWIAQHVGGGSATGATAELFKRFLTQKHIDNVAPEDSAALFRQFLEWKERQPSAR